MLPDFRDVCESRVGVRVRNFIILIVGTTKSWTECSKEDCRFIISSMKSLTAEQLGRVWLPQKDIDSPWTCRERLRELDVTEMVKIVRIPMNGRKIDTDIGNCNCSYVTKM